VALTGLACANSSFFVPLLKQLEKLQTLLEEKIETKVKKEANIIEQLISKAEKIYKVKKEKDPLYEPPMASFARAYEDFKVIEKMHMKYVDVSEYFRESHMTKEAL
jgi:hypothetical protein